MKAPLFSTYRQGENRVTSSMLAVFERVDMALLERLLSAATGEASFELVRFSNQPPGGEGVPDGEIRASFRYLFEVKTDRGTIKDPCQLQRHLKNLNRLFAEDRRLFVVTPDAERPAIVAAMDDTQVIWFNFASLAQAIGEVLADGDDPVSEREAFLLRELHHLFEVDGLLVPAEDVVVVAARFGYPTYLRYSAYICQLDRSFRPGIERMGFYTEKAIRPEFPRILHRFERLRIDAEEAAKRAATGSKIDAAAAHLIEQLLTDKTQWANTEYQVFLLSPTESSETLRLPQPISHPGTSAWTQGQRYLRSVVLRDAPTTTVELV